MHTGFLPRCKTIGSSIRLFFLGKSAKGVILMNRNVSQGLYFLKKIMAGRVGFNT